MQDDVSGSCETAYVLVKKPEKKNRYFIEKIKDLNTCVDHHNIRSTIDGNSFSRYDNDQTKVITFFYFYGSVLTNRMNKTIF